MNRPDVKLLLCMLALCALAVAVSACAERDTKLWGGIGFDLVGAAVQGVAGN